jgi:hypothetical protein
VEWESGDEFASVFLAADSLTGDSNNLSTNLSHSEGVVFLSLLKSACVTVAAIGHSPGDEPMR